MTLRTRKCLIAFGLFMVCCVYAAAAIRVELARQGAPVAQVSCKQDLCVPHTGWLSSMR
ncbi:MAG: hypothetical protein AAGC84_00835 [Pseudomonas sp.]